MLLELLKHGVKYNIQLIDPESFFLIDWGGGLR